MVCPVLMLLKRVGEFTEKAASVMSAITDNMTVTISTQQLSYTRIQLLQKTQAYEPQAAVAAAVMLQQYTPTITTTSE